MSNPIQEIIVMSTRKLPTWLAIVLVALLGSQANAGGVVDFPGPPPGSPLAEATSQGARLANNVLSAQWKVEGKTLRLAEVVNRLSGTVVSGGGEELFEIAAAPWTLKSSDFVLAGPPKVIELRPEHKAARVAERIGGRAIVAQLKHAASGAAVQWRGELRDNCHYLRQVLVLRRPPSPASSCWASRSPMPPWPAR
jgi:hypothetical protein